MKKVSVFLERFIEILFGVLIFYLWIKSIFLNGVTAESEANYIYGDRWWFHIIILVLFIGMLSFLKYKQIRFPKGTYVWLLIGGSVVGIIWITMTQTIPCVDQADVIRIASKLIDHNGEEWLPFEYMNIFPSQRTTVFLYYLLFQVIGKNNYLGIQLLNVPFLAVIMIYIGRVVKRLFPESKKTGVLLGMIACIPFTMYITFAYGTIMGLMFAVIGIDCILCCMEKFSWKYVFLASVAILLAVCSKTNYLIFMIAVLGILMIDIIEDFELRKLILPLMIIVIYIAGMKWIDFTLESISGVEISKGVPKVGYVVMGLSEDSYRGPGWFNGYTVSKYTEFNCDHDKAKTYIESDLKNILSEDLQNPSKTLDFLFRKNATQWSNPAFQCFWIYTICESEIEQSQLVKETLDKEGVLNKILMKYFNILQSLVYAGTCLCLIFSPRLNKKQMIFAIAFIGGFLFHTFWEAKGQYTVVYYFIIVPYAVIGYQSVAMWVNEAYIKKTKDGSRDDK